MYSISHVINQSINQLIAVDKEFPTSALSSLINRSVNSSGNQSINQSASFIIAYTDDGSVDTSVNQSTNRLVKPVNQSTFRLIDISTHRIARFIGRVSSVQSINESINQAIDACGRICVISEREAMIVRLDSMTRERTITDQAIRQAIDQTINKLVNQSIEQSDEQSNEPTFEQTLEQSVHQLTFRPVCFTYLWSKSYAVLAVQSTDQSNNEPINQPVSFLQVWRIGFDRPLECLSSICIDQSNDHTRNQSIKQLLYLSEGRFLVCFDHAIAIYQVINQSTYQPIAEDEVGPFWQDFDCWNVCLIAQWSVEAKVWSQAGIFLPAD